MRKGKISQQSSDSIQWFHQIELAQHYKRLDYIDIKKFFQNHFQACGSSFKKVAVWLYKNGSVIDTTPRVNIICPDATEMVVTDLDIFK